jgi:hypothetical protein
MLPDVDYIPRGPVGYCVYHYWGWCKTPRHLLNRLNEHRRGVNNPSSIIYEAEQLGLEWELARLFFDFTKNEELRFKKMRKAKNYCPICNPIGYVKEPFKYKRKSDLAMWEDHCNLPGKPSYMKVKDSPSARISVPSYQIIPKDRIYVPYNRVLSGTGDIESEHSLCNGKRDDTTSKRSTILRKS